MSPGSGVIIASRGTTEEQEEENLTINEENFRRMAGENWENEQWGCFWRI